MRLLLDEHFPQEIARQLRARGHDVVAVTERPDLTGLADDVHFASAPDERRAIVTRDFRGFRPLLTEAMDRGRETYGLVCVPWRFPPGRKGIGRLARALDAFLTAHADDDAVIKRGGEIWLEEP